MTLERKLRLLLHLRQVNPEGGASGGLAVDADMAAALFDDPVTGGQAQSRPLAHALGGKKWLERARPRFRAHPRTGVRDRQHHVIARLQFWITAHPLFLERD